MKLVYLFLALALLSPLSASANSEASSAFIQRELAQDINKNPLSAMASLNPGTLPQGANGEVTIDLKLAKGHHAYLDQFKLEIKNKDEIRLGPHRLRPVVEFYDTFSKKNRKGIKNSAQMIAALEISPECKLGEKKATLLVTYQACTKKYCLLPKTIEVPLYFVVSKDLGGTAPTSNTVKTSPTQKSFFEAISSGSINELLDHGYGLLFLAIFIAGLLTSLTPCIFPMIPITLAVLGTKEKDSKVSKRLSLSLTYVLGIALTYSALGLIAASTGALFGALLGNVYFVSAFVVLFVAMALSLFNVYELNLPNFIVQKVGNQKTGVGYSGAFISGLIAGFVASPCVGPILVAILAFVAQTQNLVLGFGLLFIYAMGFGVLFLLIGTFQNSLKFIPKAGPWMEFIKFVFGCCLIGLALFFLAPVSSQFVFGLLVAASFILIASLNGVFTSLASSSTALQKARKGFMALLFFIGLAVAAKTVFSPELLNFSDQVAKSNQPNWQSYTPETFERAKAEGKGVIIDFYADWCIACKEFERFTFPDAQVREVGKQFLWIKFDATKSSEEFEQLRKKYEIFGLPHMVFYGPDGKQRKQLTLTGFEKADAFAKRMQQAL